MSKKNEKKNNVLSLLIAILTLPLAIVLFIGFGLIYFITTVIPAPFEYLIFKRSDYYKDLEGKYAMGITHGFGYKSYKYVKKNPVLTYVLQDNGYYYYKTENAVIGVFTYGRFYFKDGEWYFTHSEDEETDYLLPLTEIRKTFEPLITEDISDCEFRIIVTENLFLNEQLPRAKENEAFVFCSSPRDLLLVK